MRVLLLASAALVLVGCKSAGAAPSVDQIPQTDTVTSNALTAPVDVVRDQWGIPHIYGSAVADVLFAEGYMMAMDRLIQMDLGRHEAEGTLAELVGAASPAVIDVDIGMRLHHMTTTAQTAWMQLQSSTAASDQALANEMTKFAAGVNAFITDAQSGKRKLPGAVQSFYDVSTTKPWTEVDEIALSYLQAFELAFDADSEINFTQIEAAGSMIFDTATDPTLLARKGIAGDLQMLAPFDPTFTLPSGWTGMNGDTSTAMRASPARDKRLLALLAADRKTVRGMGNDHVLHEANGSNNWIIGPALSANGHVLVANDTHLDLNNPPIFYLVHLIATGTAPMNVMGVGFGGAPGVVLGNNEHVAWGATVSNIDVTDVYQETVVPCSGTSGPQCVMFNGQKVPLVPRTETFNIGTFGAISSSETLTFYDVPQHGPIIPRITATHTLEPLGAMELSVKYTGHDPAQLIRAFAGTAIAPTMKDAVASLDRDFKYGGQNWVIGDDQGNFGWTQVVRVPRRAAGNAPWKVLPGDGSAEWGADMDPKYIPHAYNPKAGFLATANADPIGVTAKGDPFFSQPVVDGAPLYLGAIDYDPGTRVGRVTKRITTATAGGKKLTLDDLQSIQADTVSEWHQAYAPTYVDAAQALAEEIAKSGTHADLTAIVAGADATAKSLVSKAHDVVAAWSFDTPSGFEDGVTAAQTADSQATTIAAVWLSNFSNRALSDELTKLGLSPSSDSLHKLLAKMCTSPSSLATGTDATTGDSVLFDDLTTPAIESKRQIAAQAIIDALDFLVKTIGSDPAQWKWGSIHTLTLAFLAPVATLQIPEPGDPVFPNGFPRHGDTGTVDVGDHGLSLTDYTYAHGPAIRFVCDLDPVNGPQARNVLPGGEILDPHSPHYKDQFALWLKNQTFDLAFKPSDVIKSAQTEYATNKLGRIRFEP